MISSFLQVFRVRGEVVLFNIQIERRQYLYLSMLLLYIAEK